MNPALITQEKRDQYLALIIDKDSAWSPALSENLSKHLQVVVVSAFQARGENVIYVPFHKHIPQIPDAKYSHIFFIWNKKTPKELLSPIAEKTYAKKAKLIILVESQLDAAIVQKELGHWSREACIVVLGDIFGTPSLTSPLDQFLLETKQEGRVVLAEMGLNTLYPVLYEDCVERIVQLAFTKTEGEKIFFLYSPNAQTQFGVTHILSKIDPEIKIDISSGNSQPKSEIVEGRYLFTNDYPIVERIQKVYKEIVVLEKRKTDNFFKIPKKPKKNGKRRLFFGVYLFLTILLIPVLITCAATIVGSSFLLSAKQEVQAKNFSHALSLVNTAQRYINLADAGNRVVMQEASFFLLGNFAQILNNTIISEKEYITISQNAIDAAKRLQEVFSGTSKKSGEDVQIATEELKQLSFLMQELPALSSMFGEKNLQQAANILDSLPDIVDAEGMRTYLVLFANNMELRPEGGFIGSYGILHLNHGKFTDFKIHDVYEADGQLKGHVEPPFPERRYLPVGHLYLRDSNFDVDFVSSASSSATMYQVETGEPVDGVVSIDLSFVNAILGVIGQVFISEYNQTVDKNNFFFLTESHAEKNFFPGSTAKKDFLGSVAQAIREKLLQQSISYQKLFSVIIQEFNEKHILVAFNNEITQKPFTVNGFSSSLWDDREKSQINDYLGINEANLGVNKVNYFITRKTTHHIGIDTNGVIRETVAITYINLSKPGQWPGGDYKNYIRFILPLGASINGISVDNADQKIIDAVVDPAVYEKKNFTLPKGLEVQKTTESEKSIFGFLLTIPARSTHTVIVSYTLAQKLITANPANTYSLIFFKQPGIDSVNYSVAIDYPGSYDVSTVKGLTTREQSLVFTGDLVGDTQFNAMFSKH